MNFASYTTGRLLVSNGTKTASSSSSRVPFPRRKKVRGLAALPTSAAVKLRGSKIQTSGDEKSTLPHKTLGPSHQNESAFFPRNETGAASHLALAAKTVPQPSLGAPTQSCEPCGHQVGLNYEHGQLTVTAVFSVTPVKTTMKNMWKTNTHRSAQKQNQWVLPGTAILFLKLATRWHSSRV